MEGGAAIGGHSPTPAPLVTQEQPAQALTGGHCTSLSYAIICTVRCFIWDFPRERMSRCST